MDPLDNTIESSNPPERSYRFWMWLAISIISAQILISALTYPFLPALVPSHWNAAGRIDGYMSKLVNVLLYPLLSIVLYIVLRVVSTSGPALGRVSPRANLQFISIALAAMLLFLLMIQLAASAIALGLRIDILFIINTAVALLFV